MGMACINNGHENASAGSGVWYGEDDSRNKGIRVAYKSQSNQIGELVAILLAVKHQPANKDLLIISDSKYAIEGLTKHVKRWEERGWTDVQHKEIFQCITAWMRWHKARTKLRWVKGHNGTRGNEEADRLAGEGTAKPMPSEPIDLRYPPDQLTTGVILSKLEQKDFYRIICEKRQIPTSAKGQSMFVRVCQCLQGTTEVCEGLVTFARDH